jgi:aryl-alcohol dehydrogenase-like predicted oxidoreductase
MSGEYQTQNKTTRRKFVKGTALAGAGIALAQSSGEIPKRPLGKTGLQVSILGVGGYHVGTAESDEVGARIVHEAIDNGINFFDNAWEYHQGLSEERMGKALAGKRDKVILMTKVCTHGRDSKVAMQQLEESLVRLRTDHLDVWQIHEVIYDDDPDRIFAPGGAIEALDQAKKQGKVRFVGFTGHKDPDIHLKMLSHNYPFDTVQMPLNIADATYARSFGKLVLPELVKRGIAPLGMKSLCGSGEPVKNGMFTAEEGLRYAMSVPGVAVTISGMESLEVLHQNLAIARGFQPLKPAELSQLSERARLYASDGRYELFKTTKKYDGELGRQQHHFPASEELPV